MYQTPVHKQYSLKRVCVALEEHDKGEGKKDNHFIHNLLSRHLYEMGEDIFWNKSTINIHTSYTLFENDLNNLSYIQPIVNLYNTRVPPIKKKKKNKITVLCVYLSYNGKIIEIW